MAMDFNYHLAPACLPMGWAMELFLASHNTRLASAGTYVPRCIEYYIHRGACTQLTAQCARCIAQLSVTWHVVGMQARRSAPQDA